MAAVVEAAGAATVDVGPGWTQPSVTRKVVIRAKKTEAIDLDNVFKV
jgi:hypothetical protein